MNKENYSLIKLIMLNYTLILLIESSEGTINKLLDFIFERREDVDSDGNYRESPIVYVIEILLTILDNGSFQSFFK